jgi:pimeloyl-CoA dehydrogenase small subunit
MDFDLSEEQRLLKESVDRVLAEEYAFEQRKTYREGADGWSRALWARYAELGLLGLPFEERYGGFGGGPIETMLVMEAFGRALVLEPFLPSVVLAGTCLKLGGSEAQRGELLPALAEGKLLLAFAHGEPQARYDLANVKTTARPDGKGWVLDGAKSVVIGGDSADKLIVSARLSGGQRDEAGLGLFLVDATAKGLSRRGYATHDAGRAADIALQGVRVGAEAVIGKPGDAFPLIETVIDTGIAAVCAEAVGAMQAALDITVGYLKTRTQFGVAIGSFQSLQHRAADMLVALEQARSMAMFAAMTVDETDTVARRKAMAAAKVQIGRSGKFVGQQAVQLHGGIGMTEEYVIGHYFKRLTLIEMLFGDTDHHLAALARAGGLVEVE